MQVRNNREKVMLLEFELGKCSAKCNERQSSVGKDGVHFVDVSIYTSNLLEFIVETRLIREIYKSGNILNNGGWLDPPQLCWINNLFFTLVSQMS